MCRVLIVKCGECGAIVAAFDPERSNCGEMGYAIKEADREGREVALVPSPVTMRSCTCVRDSVTG